MFRATRENRGEDRLFEVKALMLVLGASLGIAGMIYNIGWLVWVAITVVAAAIILRLIVDRRNRTSDDA